MIKETLAAEWRERLAEHAASGLSVHEWCELHNIPEHRYYYWRTRLSASKPATSHSAVVDWISLPTKATRASLQRSTVLTVRVGTAAIDIAPGFDPALLCAIVSALGPR